MLPFDRLMSNSGRCGIALEQQEIRDRVKSASGGARGSPKHWHAPECPFEDAIEREFVLASGERSVAISNREPDFSLLSLPDHFEWMWPMHELLPNELGPLQLPFFVKFTMSAHKQYEILYPKPFNECVESLTSPDEITRIVMSEAITGGVQQALVKFVKHIPRLRDAMRMGQPEATARWNCGVADMNHLLYYRWHRNLLPRRPFVLLPVAPRSYELHSFRPALSNTDGISMSSASEIEEFEDMIYVGDIGFALLMPAKFPHA
jgi:hypothetical protein